MSSAQPTVVLVTGANQGIGFEIVKLLNESSEQYEIFLGSRDINNGTAALRLLGSPPNIHAVSLDLRNDESIDLCISSIKQRHGRLDILINNAATSERVLEKTLSTREKYAAVFDVNLFGAASLTEKAVPLLEASSAPCLIMVSSALGSISLMLSGTMPKLYPAYCASKTALNQLMAMYKAAFPRWRVNSVSPPYSSTSLTGSFAGQGEHPVVGAGTIVRICEEMRRVRAKTGKFFSSRGEIPW